MAVVISLFHKGLVGVGKLPPANKLLEQDDAVDGTNGESRVAFDNRAIRLGDLFAMGELSKVFRRKTQQVGDFLDVVCSQCRIHGTVLCKLQDVADDVEERRWFSTGLGPGERRGRRAHVLDLEI